VVLISVAGAVMKKGVPSSDSLSANESASPLRTPAGSGLQSFSNLGVQEFTHTLVKNVPVSGTVVIQTEQRSGDGREHGQGNFRQGLSRLRWSDALR
jgi:hypothetical protein